MDLRGEPAGPSRSAAKPGGPGLRNEATDRRSPRTRMATGHAGAIVGLGHWHPHELRHSGASLMLAQGTPLHVVSEVLGHASVAITKDVYGHLLEDDKRAATEAIFGALLGELRPVAPKEAEETG
ncbi:tyrosine-type recombinase/integrase [Nonomuraea sp. NPDC049695]|uniref:tyrosine-type recombinase/integrase n=1 Tax=Nonomuraea sp. NPDC049695 TaxID=3154734 RepID=UPI003420EB97